MLRNILTIIVIILGLGSATYYTVMTLKEYYKKERNVYKGKNNKRNKKEDRY